MEEKHKKMIQDNLTELCKLTICSTHFVTLLVAQNILTKQEAEMLLANTSTNIEKSHNLYQMIQTRCNSFCVLLRALKETGQTGALEILVSSSILPLEAIVSSSLSFTTSLTVSYEWLDDSTNKTTRVYKGKLNNVADVALKFFCVDIEGFAKAENEVDLYYKCQEGHHNILRFYGAGKIENYTYVVTELCETNLEKLCKNHLNRFIKLHIITQIVSGLAFLHDKQIVHGRLKPSNILIKEDTVKISNFSAAFCQSTQIGSPVNKKNCDAETYDWLAPKEYLSTASDIYSLGFIFNYVLSNGDMNGSSDMGNKIVNRRLNRLIKRMLSKRPKVRPSIKEVSEALAECEKYDYMPPVVVGSCMFMLIAVLVSIITPKYIVFKYSTDRVSNTYIEALNIDFQIGFERSETCTFVRDPLETFELLKSSLLAKLHGQHLATKQIPDVLLSFLGKEKADGPLEFRWKGKWGHGKHYSTELLTLARYIKGDNSKYVKYFRNDSHSVMQLKQHIITTIWETTKECPKATFIFEDFDLLPNGFFNFLSDLRQEAAIDLRQTIFIFLEDALSNDILLRTVELANKNKTRKGISQNDFADLYSNMAPFVSTPDNMHIIIYLPLEREHFISCCQQKLKESEFPELTAEDCIIIANKSKYVPKSKPIYEENGFSDFLKDLGEII